MDSVIRGLIVYFFLLLVFRLSGKRTVSQITTFDLVVLLIISETTQQAMIDGDSSMTNGLLLILTLIGADIALSFLKEWVPTLEKWMDGTPLVVVEDGRLLTERARKARVDEGDILAAARELQGLERMEQIKYAVLERSGHITVIPKEGSAG